MVAHQQCRWRLSAQLDNICLWTLLMPGVSQQDADPKWLDDHGATVPGLWSDRGLEWQAWHDCARHSSAAGMPPLNRLSGMHQAGWVSLPTQWAPPPGPVAGNTIAGHCLTSYYVSMTVPYRQFPQAGPP